jgi:hypothetical protein
MDSETDIVLLKKVLFTNGLDIAYAHRHRSILGAAGHIILTPANQLMVMGLKI